MTLTSFDSDICSVEFPLVLTGSVFDHKASWHLSTVDVDWGVDNYHLLATKFFQETKIHYPDCRVDIEILHDY